MEQQRIGAGKTIAERRAYARGYHARTRNDWPLHKPPLPPHEIVAGLQSALVNLKQRVEGELATFPEDDPLRGALLPHIDEADEALSAVGRWLADEANTESTHPPP